MPPLKLSLVCKLAVIFLFQHQATKPVERVSQPSPRLAIPMQPMQMAGHGFIRISTHCDIPTLIQPEPELSKSKLET